MRIIFISIVILCHTVSFSQPTISQQKCYGGTGNEWAGGIVRTANNGYIIAGETFSPISGDVNSVIGGGDAWIVKFNSAGDTVWKRTYGGTARDEVFDIKNTIDGGVIFVGSTRSIDFGLSSHGVEDFWIVKLDSSGNLQWQKNYGGSLLDRAESVDTITGGGYYVSGFTLSTDFDVSGIHSVASDIWLIRLTESGDLVWSKCIGSSTSETNPAITSKKDKGVYLAAYSGSISDGDLINTDSNKDYFLANIDSNGLIINIHRYGNELMATGCYLIQDSDSTLIFQGLAEMNGGDVSGWHGYSDVWLARIDTAGNIIWQNCYGGSVGEDDARIFKTGDNNLLISCITSSSDGDITENKGNWDIWVFKVNKETGNLIWQKSMGGNTSESSHGCIELTDGRIIVAGATFASNNGDVGQNNGNRDIWKITLGFAPVPLLLYSFDARLVKDEILVNWSTSQEINTNNFIVERSLNGINYSSIGSIPAASNSATIRNYELRDPDAYNLGKEIFYYRLKSLDQDRSFTYSEVKTVKIPLTTKFVIYPNPASDQVKIKTSVTKNLPADIWLLNPEGRELKHIKTNLIKGENTIAIKTSHFPAGQYILKLIVEDTVQEIPFVLFHQ